jgi:hypothetical protein
MTTGLEMTSAAATSVEVVHLGSPDDINSSQGSGGSSAAESTSTLEDAFVWPEHTDIIFPPGSQKVTLMNQRPLLRVVIQNAMELVRVNLLFDYAFPDPAVSLITVKMSLLTSSSEYPGAADIHRRLLFDEEYMARIIPLVSFLHVEIIILNRVYSHALGLRFFEAKSKSGAAQLYRMNCRPWALLMKSDHMF